MFPFNGQELFFGIVALLASGDHVPFGGLSASGNGHNMVHGQLLGRDRAPAVVADALGTASFPPLGVPKFSGLAALPFDVFLLQIICKWLHMSFYLILKNLVLYAMPETGYASKLFDGDNGMVEWWNDGLRTATNFIRAMGILIFPKWATFRFSAQYSSIPTFQPSKHVQ